MSKANIDTNVKAKISSANGSNLGPIGVVICSIIFGACQLEHNFIVCKHLLQPVILGLDFDQDSINLLSVAYKPHLIPLKH